MTATNRLIIWNRHEKPRLCLVEFYGKTRNHRIDSYQKSTEHVKADEVENGEATAAGSLLAGVVVWLRITKLPWQAGQHDLLPGLTCGAPVTARGTMTQVRGETHYFHLLLALNQMHTWRASGQLEGRFESCCCDWFAFRRPWLFSQKPVETKKCHLII